MKVITIGRGMDNDVVINDNKASRHHLQIIRDNGCYKIVDLKTANGTFVNGSKIKGKQPLHPSDRVQIGYIYLPWQSYFERSNSKSSSSIAWIVSGLATMAIIAVGLYLFIQHQNNAEKEVSQSFELPTQPQPPAKTTTVIKMVEKNGNLFIPTKVNGQELNFVFDTGASSICISTLEAAILFKNGLLTDNDKIGETSYVDANGNHVIGTKINLRKILIGDRELDNVEAIIIENPTVDCLLGQTVLSRFGKYTIDNKNNEIIFE